MNQAFALCFSPSSPGSGASSTHTFLLQALPALKPSTALNCIDVAIVGLSEEGYDGKVRVLLLTRDSEATGYASASG